MRKKISLFLVLCMFFSLLVGCTGSVKPNPVAAEKPPKVADKVYAKIDGEKVDKGDKGSKVEVDKNVVIEYSKDNSIIKCLEENGYDMSEGYALYPNDTYFYPEYLEMNDELQIVYLSRETLLNSFNVEVVNDIYGRTKSSFDSFSFNNIGLGSAVNESMVMTDATATVGIELPMSGIGFNTSEYKEVEESNYLSTLTSPLSTFAADVDTASYTNFRSILRDTLWVEEEHLYVADSLHNIRVEEMMNYFSYDFNEGNEYINGKFAITAEIGDTPWNSDSKLLVVNVKAKDLAIEEHEGSNLVFLVDVSGSMNSVDKIGLLVESLKLLTNELTEKDTVSIITYASDDRVVLEGAKGSDKDEIIDALEELVAGGGTNGEGGIERAYEVAQKYMEGHSNSRIIMCSDGDLNVGISSESELIDLITEKKETGIYLSVLGFGAGNYKDNKMEALANNGNGNYYYIDSLKEGYKVLVEDLTSTLVTIADDVKFQLEFNPEYIKAYRKIGYENRDMANEDFADDTKDGGEVGYGHEVTVVYELVMTDSDMNVGNTELKYQNSVVTGSTDWLTVSIRYKDHGDSESNLIEYVVNGEDYTQENSEDWRFVSDIIGLSLITNNSEYRNGLEINTIIEDLKDLDLVDKDKQEFLGLVIGYRNYLENIDEDLDEYYSELKKLTK